MGFFKKKETIDSLLALHKAKTKEKKDIEKRLETLKVSALDGVSADLVDKIKSAGIELDICQTALEEIRKKISLTLEEGLAVDYARLPELEADYQREFAEVSGQAGDMIGRAVVILQKTGRASHDRLASTIIQTYRDFSRVDGYRDQMAAFSDRFLGAMAEPAELIDFKTRRLEIQRIKGLVPGSVAAKNHVESKTMRLLDEEPKKIQDEKPKPFFF